jgi:hypothetical protein
MFHIPAHKNVDHPAGQFQLNSDESDSLVGPFDTLSFVMALEAGELDEDEVIEGFQHLINSGLAWQLQGSYGRAAAALIESGRCTDPRR